MVEFLAMHFFNVALKAGKDFL